MDGSAWRSLTKPRVRIGDVGFDSVTIEEAVVRITQMARLTDRPRQVCTANLDHLYLAAKDTEFRGVYAAADLVVADGAPIVWLSRMTRGIDALPSRVAGSDLFWEIARASAHEGLRMFLLGGRPGAAARAARVAEERYRGARVVGTYCPPAPTFDSLEEQGRIASIVRAARPDVLLVALGAPKQEKWIARYKDALRVPVSIGVGGSFEMAAGICKRAPVWMQRVGMEWLYRFAQEPTRLFDRYFRHDLPFFAYLAARAAASVVRRPGLPPVQGATHGR